MICDTLHNSFWYNKLCPGIDAAFAFLREHASLSLADGRHPIDGDRLFALVQSYETKPVAESLLEAHRRYADIQALLSGREWVGYAPLDGLPVEQPYSAERDVLFARGRCDLLALTPGNFILLLPQDAHMPGRFLDAPEKVRKVVVKVLLPQTAM